MWLARAFATGLASLTGQKRKADGELERPTPQRLFSQIPAAGECNMQAEGRQQEEQPAAARGAPACRREVPAAPASTAAPRPPQHTSSLPQLECISLQAGSWVPPAAVERGGARQHPRRPPVFREFEPRRSQLAASQRQRPVAYGATQALPRPAALRRPVGSAPTADVDLQVGEKLQPGWRA